MNNDTKIIVTTEDFMTVWRASKILGVARLTIYRWIKAGKMLSLQMAGITFVPKSEVARLQGCVDKGNGHLKAKG